VAFENQEKRYCPWVDVVSDNPMRTLPCLAENLVCGAIGLHD